MRTLSSLKRLTRRFLRDEDGATAIEYAGLLTLIAVIILLSVTQLGTGLKTLCEDIAAKFTAMGF